MVCSSDKLVKYVYGQGRIERENKSQGKWEFVDETVYEPVTSGLDRIKRASNDSVNFYRFYATT